MEKKALLVNLRKSRKPLAELIHAWMDHVLQRPLVELFNTNDLAHTIAVGVRSVAKASNNEAFLKNQIAASLSELQQLESDAKVPPHTAKAIRYIASQPFVLDEELVAELLDHQAARILLREVLQLSLLGFAEQLASVIPGGKIASQFVGNARGIAALLVGSVGKSLEDHVNESVEEALSPALDLTAERLADKEFANELADWRRHVLDVLLEQPVKELVAQLDHVDPAELAAQTAAFLKGIAEWPGLEETIKMSVEEALDRAGDQSLNNIMSSANMGNDWRAEAEKQLVEAIWPFIQSAPFDDWLNRAG